MGGPSRRARMSIVGVTIVAALTLAGCSSGGSPSEDGSGRPSSRPSSAVPATPDAATAEDLRAAVLTTADLPVGGWTESPDSGSSSSGGGGTTSTDADGPGACAADFSEVVGDLPDGASADAQWTRDATSSFLQTGISVDADAEQHVRAIGDSVRGCPTAGATYTIDGQQQRIVTTALDLGTWGDATSCLQFEVNASNSFAGKVCAVAVDGTIVLVTTGSRFSFQVPEDDELRQIVAAAVDKAEQHL